MRGYDQLAQRAVRKPRGGYGAIALVQEYLNRAPLDVKAEIIDTRVQLLQGCKNPFLDLVLIRILQYNPVSSPRGKESLEVAEDVRRMQRSAHSERVAMDGAPRSIPG